MGKITPHAGTLPTKFLLQNGSNNDSHSATHANVSIYLYSLSVIAGVFLMQSAQPDMSWEMGVMLKKLCLPEWGTPWQQVDQQSLALNHDLVSVQSVPPAPEKSHPSQKLMISYIGP